jgi:hypothetical protein
MNKFERFRNCYGLREQDVIFVPYGSRVYGTARANSDEDYMAIVPENRKADTGAEYDHNNVNIHIYNRRDFQDQLKRHKIHALEAWYHPERPLEGEFQFRVHHPTLRHSLSQKASHSFVKAKKKIEVEHDYLIGWKSLFHSLRILDFGIQIAREGCIRFNSANEYWNQIINEKQTDWELLQERYKPVYNAAATEFRKLAPKE